LLRRAVARPQEGGSTFVTGGDVSRFQRTSVPRQTSAAPADSGVVGTSAPEAPRGPTVRVTRGKDTTVESVSAGSGALLDRTASGASAAGRTAPVALGTLK